jgi:hypothetical protein
MEYLIHRARVKPELAGEFNGPAWSQAEVARIASFHAKSSAHRPQTEAKLLHDEDGLYVIFHVHDRYVCCTRSVHQSMTCQDSCVELFIAPGPAGYFNFEMNCGGTMLLFYITDPARGPKRGFKEIVEVPIEQIETIRTYHSMPKTLEAEIVEPVEWVVEYFVPWKLFERYAGPLGPAEARRWRGNFYKCAGDSSHPHWGSWSPIGEALNFHVPAHFGEFRFEAGHGQQAAGSQL